MKNLMYFSILLFGSLFLLPSCAVNKQAKWLENHAQLLARAANSTKMSNEDKLDILANSYVKMMHQSLNFANPKKGVEYATKYSKQNNANIDTILNSLKGWKQDMGPLELVAFGVKMARKPYFKDLIGLYPRFQRKYKTYSTIFNMAGKVKKGLIDLGGSKLKGLGL